MLFLIRVILTLLLLYMGAFCQQNDPVKKVTALFRAFKYIEAISEADSILNQDTTLTSSQIIEIKRMKAISHFTIGEELMARITFNTILEFDPKFELDPVQNSPKIIDFFNQVKIDFLESQIIDSDTSKDIQRSENSLQEMTLRPQFNIKSAMVKSMILPGWGHVNMDRKKTGSLLIIGSLLTLPPALYYSYDAYEKEKDYLNETIASEIEKNYDRYNTSYKLRNGFITGYVLIWLYSQWDLFSNDNQEQIIKMQSGVSRDMHGDLILTTSIRLTF